MTALNCELWINVRILSFNQQNADIYLIRRDSNLWGKTDSEWAAVFSSEPLLFIQGVLNMLMKLAILDVSGPCFCGGRWVRRSSGQMVVRLTLDVYAWYSTGALIYVMMYSSTRQTLLRVHPHIMNEWMQNFKNWTSHFELSVSLLQPLV